MANKIINFHAKTPAGATINNLPVTVRAVVYGTGFYDTQLNQQSHRTLDGNLQTFTNGIVLHTGTMILKGLTKPQGELFIAWWRDDLQFKENRFDIELNGNLINIGNGEGVDALICNSLVSSSDTIYSLHSPGFYNFKFNFERKR